MKKVRKATDCNTETPKRICMVNNIIMHSESDMTDNLPALGSEQSIVPQADNDAHLVALWLHGRSEHTQRAYKGDALEFFSFIKKSLHAVTLGDIQSFSDELHDVRLAPASVRRKMAAVKSLIAFGYRLGYLSFDVSRPVRLGAVRETLAERILSESEVQRMIALENHPRNHAILLCLYGGALRVSELCDLKWKHLTDREEGGQVSVFGKGNKTRQVLLPISVWNAIKSLREDRADEDPVFRSRKGGHLDPSQVWRIGRKASERAGIDKAVSCHWLRHAHCSHAMDRGAPIHLVQSTCGHASVATTGRYLHARPSDSSSRYLPL